ncbi:MAG: hypothetical protein ACKPKO_21975 [Candidatus Fonsibacter sp.]
MVMFKQYKGPSQVNLVLFQTLEITGTTRRPQTPTVQGCCIGQATTGYTAI